MPKLIIQIPAYNEAETLQAVLSEIPRQIPGIDDIKVLVIDDGSDDGTSEVALNCGADYVVRHRQNRGLSNTFMTGIQTSIKLGADIIVNTDGDNQYPGKYIEALVTPLLDGTADLVIGDRQPLNNKNFSPLKQRLEVLGSWFLRLISETNAPDAPSGFRAYSRYTALRLQVHNRYSYTLETLIQAGKERYKIAHVTIITNPTPRASRLHKGMFNFIWKQGGAIVRSYILYQPLKTFGLIGIPFLTIGSLLVLRFLWLYIMGDSGVGRYVQSVSIGGTLMIFGVLLVSLGLLGDSLKANRQILEEILVQLRDVRGNTDSLSEMDILGLTVLQNQNHKNKNKDIPAKEL